MTIRAAAAVLGLAIVTTTASAQGVRCQAVSGPQTAALVELYTSEGCDSCPPADRWLRGLSVDAIKSGRLVPLALHVDYWDYIGWKDPYAKPAFAVRQREMARLSNATVVYTPQVMVAGRDFRDWSRPARFDAEVKRVNVLPASASIALAIEGADDLHVKVEASLAPGVDRAKAVLYVALTQSGLTSQVRAGENRGVTLAHDHVARGWWGPISADAEGLFRVAQVVRSPDRRGIGAAAFVQDRQTGRVLQAVTLTGC